MIQSKVIFEGFITTSRVPKCPPPLVPPPLGSLLKAWRIRVDEKHHGMVYCMTICWHWFGHAIPVAWQSPPSKHRISGCRIASTNHSWILTVPSAHHSHCFTVDILTVDNSIYLIHDNVQVPKMQNSDDYDDVWWFPHGGPKFRHATINAI